MNVKTILGLTTMTPRSKLTLWLLMAAGLLVNCLPLPMLPAVDFLFGSVAAMVVLHGYGLGWGALCALVAGSYTIVLWHHPYALVIFVAEVLFVGLLLRPNRSIVLLDGIFWVVLGMPLVWLFYNRILHVEADETRLVMLKDAVNGIFNALLASLLVLHSPLRDVLNAGRETLATRAAPGAQSATRQPSRERMVSLSQTIFNLAVGCVLFPALLLTILNSRYKLGDVEDELLADLKTSANVVSHTMQHWQQRRLDVVTQLAELAASTRLQPSPRLQRDVELLARSSTDFTGLCVALTASPTGTPRAIALYPARDTLGRPNNAANFSTQSQLQRLAAARRALISEVFQPPAVLGPPGAARRPNNTSRTAQTKGNLGVPIVAVQAPIRSGGRFRGYAAGTIDLDSVRMWLSYNLPGNTIRATIVDERGRIVGSTMSERRTREILSRAPGTVRRFDSSSYQWLPARRSMTAIERWSDSIFVRETPMGSGTTWRLILEEPLAPYRSALYASSARSLALMLLLSLAALGVAAELSRSLTRPLAQLALMTTNLPAHLVGGAPSGGASPGQESRSGEAQRGQAQRGEAVQDKTTAKDLPAVLLPKSNGAASSNTRLACESATSGRVENQASASLPVALSAGLPDGLPDGLPWPHSSVTEMDTLVGNFESMVGTLQQNFQAVETARGQLEEEQARLSEANRLKDEFLAILSHELRTPLVPVIGYADLLARGVLGGDETVDAARAIERNARHQLRLIEDLLDMSRIISGKLLMSIGTVSLLHVMRDAVTAVQLSADTKNVGLTLSMPDEFRNITGDEARLRQVMLNLITNAIKFTPEGGQIYITLEHAGDRAEITVADTGQGITADFLPFVFDRFRQDADHLTRAAGGLGLGLSIVQHIVRAHDGRVEAHSAGEGQGSVFIVHLPLPAQALPAQALPALPTALPQEQSLSALPGKPLTNRLHGAARAATGRLRGANILVVDDEADSRARLSAMLQREGAHVADAGSAAEGLQTALRDRPGIILSALADVGSQEFLQRVRAASTLEDVAVVAFTNQASEQARAQTFNGGFNACLSKPAQSEDVIDLLESLMDRH